MKKLVDQLEFAGSSNRILIETETQLSCAESIYFDHETEKTRD